MNGPSSPCPRIKIRFGSLLQRHTAVRDAELEVPPDLDAALLQICEAYGIPWKGELEEVTAVFVNRIPAQRFRQEERKLASGDTVSFIPLMGGG
jgi:molybdopterin converting factor small subunit